MHIHGIMLLIGFGILFIYARPFEGALWVGIACIAGGVYWAWRYGKSLRRKNEASDYEREK